jgi:microcompartment protein CcmK/EutM
MTPPMPPPPPVSILGGWKTNFNGYLSIVDGTWYSMGSYGDSVYRIETWNPEWIVMQNPATASYNPSKYTKVHHHGVGSGFGFCMAVYDAVSPAAALAVDVSTIYNSSNAGSGCNGFGHTVASPYDIPLKGSWVSNFGAYTSVTNNGWYSFASYGNSAYKMEAYSNNKALMQNSATASYNPSKWTKSQFHAVGAGFGYCSSVYNGDNATHALMKDTSAIYNSSDAAKGCNGFGHTVLTRYNMPMAGTWLTNYGTYITITNEMYYSVSSWGKSAKPFEAYSDKLYLTQNSATDAYNPSKWTMTEFHAVGAGFGFCSSVYNGVTAEAAIKTDTSAIYNSSNAGSGCNGFGHTTMSAYAMPIAGNWVTNFNQNVTISATTWTTVSSYGTSTLRIEAYGNNWILAQNSATASYNPSLWTKIEFHTVGSGFGYCSSVYNGATSAAALLQDTSAIYNSSNAGSGCNGFGHTVASPA